MTVLINCINSIKIEHKISIKHKIRLAECPPSKQHWIYKVKINLKNKWILPLLLASFSAFGSATKSLQLGIYGSNITYTEPDVMQEEGELFGLMGRFIYRDHSWCRYLY